MSGSILELIVNSARPYKGFEWDIDGNPVKLYTRRLSAAEVSDLQACYNTEFNKTRDELEGSESDLTTLRKNFSRQPKDKLIRFIIESDRLDYLTESSTELDDLPFGDKRVQAKADEKQAEATILMEGASEDDLVDQAVERRSYMISHLRASQKQNRLLLLKSIYTRDSDNGTYAPLFQSLESIEESLDTDTIAGLLAKAGDAMGDASKDSPLTSAGKKPSRKRMSSQSNSEGE